MQKKPAISVVGLGKLGACYSAFYAESGFYVVGTDINDKSVALINKGKAPVIEPGLPEYIARNTERLRATTDTRSAVLETDVTFVIVPTPSKKDGTFSLEYILAACEAIGSALKEKDTYHIISVVSTVLPGDSREKIIPALEKRSGKKCGVDFGYCYNPSLIAIGEIFKNLEHPDFLFLGAYDEKSKNTLSNVFESSYPKFAREIMSIESVEIAKIALNSYITTKITFANMLAELCENVPYADVSNVTNALGKDSRIGSRYLKSGLGYGGPCFPRDNAAFSKSASRYGVSLPISLAVDEINSSLPKTTVARIKKLMRHYKFNSIGILGVSYKPNTTMSEASQALEISKILSRSFPLRVYEPLGHREAKALLPDSVIFENKLSRLVEKSNAIFVSNNDPIFSCLPDLVNRKKTSTLIYDPWNMFPVSSFASHVIYKVPGRNRLP